MYDTTKEDWKDVPQYLLEGLVRYAQHREPLGHFLTAVLEDRLSEAVDGQIYIVYSIYAAL